MPLPSPWFCAKRKDRGPGARAQKAWILGSASRPQDDGGALGNYRPTSGAGVSPNPESIGRLVSGAAHPGVPEIGTRFIRPT